MSFTLLWSKILNSSLWVKESKETRLVWITLLAMKNRAGLIQSSVVGLADRAKVSPEECEEALRVLTSPDPNDTSKIEQGIRLRVVPGGWEVVNHDLYRFSSEEKRELWRQQKADQRAKTPGRKPGRPRKEPKASNVPLPGEAAYVKIAEQEGQATAERLMDQGQEVPGSFPEVSEVPPGPNEHEQISQQNQGRPEDKRKPIQQALSPEEEDGWEQV